MCKNNNNLIEYFITNNATGKKCKEKYLEKENPELFKQTIQWCNDYNLDIAFKEKCYCYAHKLLVIPSCLYCGKSVKYINFNIGYRKYCSIQCSGASDIVRDNIKKTIKKKYGVDHYSKTKEYAEKVKITSLERYGVDHYSKTKDGVDKVKKANIEKYGVVCPIQNLIIREKIKKTILERYIFNTISF